MRLAIPMLLAAANVVSPLRLGAQAAPADTIPLRFGDFYAQVAANHPVVQQANLVLDAARQDVRIARGGFDPKLGVRWDSKSFDGKQYYDYVTSELKIPTPFGSDLKLGYERAVGDRIAADRYTPGRGLLLAGLSIPLGQRIITDERRTALAEAQALRDAAEGDRQGMVNKLFLQAAKDYAAWFEAYRRSRIAEEGVRVAAFRLDAVRERVRNGDNPAIDTLEARLELQRRQVAQLEADGLRFSAQLDVARHLWSPRGQPIELAPNVVPVEEQAGPSAADSTAIRGWLARAEASHPELQKIAGKIRASEALRRFAAQQVIPFAELQVNGLAERGTGTPLPVGDALRNDGKLAGAIESPLLFLKERGKLGQTNAKLETQRLDQLRLRREVGYAVRAAVNDLAVLEQSIAAQALTVEQARLLLAGEQRRFENGESTLFIVNTRERLVLDEAVKLAVLQAKLVSARAELGVAIGDPRALP